MSCICSVKHSLPSSFAVVQWHLGCSPTPARKFILPHCALVHSPCRFYVAPSETRRCTISQWLSNFDLGPIKDRATEAEAKLQCAAFDSNRSKAGSATSVPNSDRCYRSLTFKRQRIQELEIPLPSTFILHSRIYWKSLRFISIHIPDTIKTFIL